ncbi:MAG: hypothetical protein H6640_24020 [Caldilineaceae bacterium]|nr:hypothetical protein [Caldilineaceae bacterium]
MAGNANLIISITAKDGTSSAIRKVKMNLGDLEKSSGDLGESVGGLGDIFGSTLGKIGAGIGAAFAVERMASTAFELGKVGAAAERTQASFEQMAAGVGSSGDAMLAAMRTATAGTVGNSELMLAANRAIMLGVADNADEMARLMAAAIERGRALGVSASQAVSDVITGIGRMSPQILDNLGIVGATKAIDDYAKSLGKTSEQLTDVERKQALVNVVLAGASGPAVVDDAAAAFERMDASLQNAKEAMGILFSPAVVVVADSLAKAAELLVDSWGGAGNEMDAMLRNLKNQSLTFRDQLITSDGGNTYAQQQAQSFETLRYAIMETNRALAAGVPDAQGWGDTLAFVADESLRTGEVSRQNLTVLAALLPIIQGQTTAYIEQAAVIDGETVRLNTMVQAAEQAQQRINTILEQTPKAARGGLESIAQGIASAQGVEAAVEWLRQANAELMIQIDLWTQAGYAPEEITGVVLPAYLDNLRKASEEANKAATATANIGKGAVQADTTAAGALARLARRVDNITARANIASAALSRMGRQAGATRTGQRGWEWIGTPASYEPVMKATDSVTAFGDALQEAIDVGTGIGGGAESLRSPTSSIT